jgi:hypothetical protein
LTEGSAAGGLECTCAASGGKGSGKRTQRRKLCSHKLAVEFKRHDGDPARLVTAITSYAAATATDQKIDDHEVNEYAGAKGKTAGKRVTDISKKNGPGLDVGRGKGETTAAEQVLRSDGGGAAASPKRQEKVRASKARGGAAAAVDSLSPQERSGQSKRRDSDAGGPAPPSPKRQKRRNSGTTTGRSPRPPVAHEGLYLERPSALKANAAKCDTCRDTLNSDNCLVRVVHRFAFIRPDGKETRGINSSKSYCWLRTARAKAEGRVQSCLPTNAVRLGNLQLRDDRLEPSVAAWPVEEERAELQELALEWLTSRRAPRDRRHTNAPNRFR